MRSIPRWTLVVLAAVVIAVAADVALFAFTAGSSTAPAVTTRGPTDVVAVIDAAHGRVVDDIRVGKQPTIVAAGYGSVWVLNKLDGTVSHIDAKTRKLVRTITLAEPTDDLTLGEGGVWLAGHGDLATFTPKDPHGTTTLHLLDPATDEVNRTLQLRTGGILVAAGAGALWTTGFVGGDVRGGARSDPQTGSLKVLDVGVFGDLIAAGQTGVYYVTSLGARVQLVDRTTGRLVASLSLAHLKDLIAGRLPPNPTGIALGGGSVWLSQTNGTVLRIDPGLHRVEQTIPACHGDAVAIAYGGHSVWAACGDGSAVRVDPATNRAAIPIVVGGLPRGIAADADEVWVTVN